MSEWVIGFESSFRVFKRCLVSADDEGLLCPSFSKGANILHQPTKGSQRRTSLVNQDTTTDFSVLFLSFQSSNLRSFDLFTP